MVIVPSSITDIKGSSIDLQIKSSHIGYRDQAFKINFTQNKSSHFWLKKIHHILFIFYKLENQVRQLGEIRREKIIIFVLTYLLKL